MYALPEGKNYTLKGKDFHFSVASSPIQLMRGLKGVRDLSPFDGMVFDFGSPVPAIMTPRGCEMALDLAFLSEEGEIIEITKLDPSLGFTRASAGPARYALEAPAGFFTSHNIAVGDILEEH